MSDATTTIMSPFEKAVQDMKLSPQEQYLYFHHLNNLYGPGKVQQPDGSISTLLQAVVSGPGSLYYNIPTVWDGQILNPQDAAIRAGQAGWGNFPAYVTPELADARYETLHGYLEQDTEAYQNSRN